MFALSTGHTQMLHSPPRPTPTDRKWNSDPEVAPNCPRCASANTKFCYYNNYSLSQPRYFCKSCRRYWTKGGSLRNVPVGGGCRKSRRSRASRAAQSSGLNSLNCRRNLSSRSPEEAFGDDTNAEERGPDIDLAVVFANYLNPVNSDNNHEPASSVEWSNNSQNDAVVESASLDELLEGDDLSEFGLQSLLNDEVVQDALWSDAAAVPSLSSEMEEQLDYCPAGDRSYFQEKSSGNCETDGWSLFDFSGLI